MGRGAEKARASILNQNWGQGGSSRATPILKLQGLSTLTYSKPWMDIGELVKLMLFIEVFG